ncbi:hypothetical protein CK203_108824 [Vitis vinifera]|uniref:Uncharacterized protein n=1 Tax=Vitis vinifera TaxID=29760 RepID=A0A438CDZ4_VITVI|nr:hypothetical protein CK203_108824 [Vitis vinifera]
MCTFTYWLRQKVEVVIGNEKPASEALKWIVHSPSHYVFKYHGYFINGFQSSSVIGIDNKNGMRVDDLGFTLADFNKMAHK